MPQLRAVGSFCGEGGCWCYGGRFLKGGAHFVPNLLKHRIAEFGWLVGLFVFILNNLGN